MTFRTLMGCSNTELKETRGSLGHITITIVGSNVTNSPHTARIRFESCWGAWNSFSE